MKHAAFPTAGRVAQHLLGMAECGWRGLSEGWLLRHLGDVHWAQIAQAMGQSVAVFRDDSGAPVYAAFCAIGVNVAQPSLARPGVMLAIESRLCRVSATRLMSVHDLSIDGMRFGDVTMITTFVRHDPSGRNAQIQRAQPRGILTVPMMDPAADGGLIEAAAHLYRQADIRTSDPMTDVTPCPTTDFNAAGLLYCANYPMLADRAEWVLARRSAEGYLRRRLIVFLGNVDPGEPVTACLAGHDASPDVSHTITLRSGDRVIARIITAKSSGVMQA